MRTTTHLTECAREKDLPVICSCTTRCCKSGVVVGRFFMQICPPIDNFIGTCYEMGFSEVSYDAGWNPMLLKINKESAVT